METERAEAETEITGAETETENPDPDTEMSARKLEEFIHLIEAAERVSSEVKLPRLCTTLTGILFLTFCFSLASDRSTARPASARPQPSSLVPNLKLPLKETPSPSQPRFLGPAASHCGLTLSEVSTPASNVPTQTRGSSMSSASTQRTLPSSPARTVQPPEAASRWSSSETSTSYAEAIINLQRNTPYVRRISQDMHPASPDRL